MIDQRNLNVNRFQTPPTMEDAEISQCRPPKSFDSSFELTPLNSNYHASILLFIIGKFTTVFVFWFLLANFIDSNVPSNIFR